MGEFLKFEVSSEIISSKVIDPGSLPFDQISYDANFRAIVVKPDQFRSYFDKQFAPQMMAVRASKPWFPAEKINAEVNQCSYTSYASSGDEDFKFDKNTGGQMVYYKVTCLRIDNQIYVALSSYENNFVLSDIRYEEITRESSSFLFIKESRDIKKVWFEKRYLTLKDLNQLRDFILREFAANIRRDYGQYIKAAS